MPLNRNACLDVMTVDPFSATVSKSFTNLLDKQRSFKFARKEKISTWELIEGVKNASSLCLSWYGSSKLERKMLRYEYQQKLLIRHKHMNIHRELSYLKDKSEVPNDIIELAEPVLGELESTKKENAAKAAQLAAAQASASVANTPNMHSNMAHSLQMDMKLNMQSPMNSNMSTSLEVISDDVVIIDATTPNHQIQPMMQNSMNNNPTHSMIMNRLHNQVNPAHPMQQQHMGIPGSQPHPMGMNGMQMPMAGGVNMPGMDNRAKPIRQNSTPDKQRGQNKKQRGGATPKRGANARGATTPVGMPGVNPLGQPNMMPNPQMNHGMQPNAVPQQKIIGQPQFQAQPGAPVPQPPPPPPPQFHMQNQPYPNQTGINQLNRPVNNGQPQVMNQTLMSSNVSQSGPANPQIQPNMPNQPSNMGAQINPNHQMNQRIASTTPQPAPASNFGTGQPNTYQNPSGMNQMHTQVPPQSLTPQPQIQPQSVGGQAPSQYVQQPQGPPNPQGAGQRGPIIQQPTGRMNYVAPGSNQTAPMSNNTPAIQSQLNQPQGLQQQQRKPVPQPNTQAPGVMGIQQQQKPPMYNTMTGTQNNQMPNQQVQPNRLGPQQQQPQQPGQAVGPNYGVNNINVSKPGAIGIQRTTTPDPNMMLPTQQSSQMMQNNNPQMMAKQGQPQQNFNANPTNSNNYMNQNQQRVQMQPQQGQPGGIMQQQQAQQQRMQFNQNQTLPVQQQPQQGQNQIPNQNMGWQQRQQQNIPRQQPAQIQGQTQQNAQYQQIPQNQQQFIQKQQNPNVNFLNSYSNQFN